MSPSAIQSLDNLRQRTAVVYDGFCPFCTSYVQLQRFRETIGPVELVDAREHPDLSRSLIDAGYDLDQGMVFSWQGELFHGEDSLHRIALLSSKVGIANRLMAKMFQNAAVCRAMYPLLRSGRNAALALLRRPKLSSSR